MRFRGFASREENLARWRASLGVWIDWFAWYPVRMGNSREFVWWEWVQRKKECGYYAGDCVSYRPITKSKNAQEET